MHKVLGSSVIITAGGMGESRVKDAKRLVQACLLAVQHFLLTPQHRVNLSQKPPLPVTQRLQVASD